MRQRTLPALRARLFIGGAWCEGSSGETLPAISPGSGERIGVVTQASPADVHAAVAAAQRAFTDWSRATAHERAAALRRIGEACERRREDLAWALALDQGKPLHAEAYDEVDELIGMWHAAAEDGLRLEGSIPPSADSRKRVLVLRRAVGPVAVITPWNWPYTMPAEIVAPALAAGDTVVWLPAPSTSACSGVLAECVAEAELPPGVFNFLCGPGPIVGEELVAHPQIAAIGFIGSTQTGLRIAGRAAGKRLLLEMGGNGPLVVLEDADLDAAARAALSACFLCAGQSCTAGERLLVHKAVRRELVEGIAALIEREVRLGDPLAPETTLGPMNNAAVAAKMEAHVRDALERGARAVCGGERARGFPTDLYWPATLLDGVPPGALAAREETFGPIAPVVEIRSLEEAIELTNSSPYGLLAAIFTADLRRALRYADEARTGLVNINETTNYWENHLPFGGRAGSLSGIGRVGGRYPFEALTDLQTIVIGA